MYRDVGSRRRAAERVGPRCGPLCPRVSVRCLGVGRGRVGRPALGFGAARLSGSTARPPSLGPLFGALRRTRRAECAGVGVGLVVRVCGVRDKPSTALEAAPVAAFGADRLRLSIYMGARRGSLKGGFATPATPLGAEYVGCCVFRVGRAAVDRLGERYGCAAGRASSSWFGLRPPVGRRAGTGASTAGARTPTTLGPRRSIATLQPQENTNQTHSAPRGVAGVAKPPFSEPRRAPI